MRSRDVARAMQRLPGGAFLLTGPRAIGFSRQERSTAIPAAPRTTLAAAALVDELSLVLMRTGRAQPTRHDIDRIADDLRVAVPLFEREGWLDDPLSFHTAPPAPTEVTVRPAQVRDATFERISFDSDFAPDSRLPGATQWLLHERNRRARAWVVRAPSPEPRPWVVHLHGFGMGRAGDVRTFRSFGYRDHGVNVIHPILPLHGPRRHGRRSGDGAVSFDAMANVLSISQAVWDVRRCIRWAREQGATAVGVHGVSLGAYTAAVLAGVEDGLACVVAGIPPVDLVALLARNAPAASRAAARAGGILGDEANAVHRVVSPMVSTPLVPQRRRFIYAGIADRLSTAAHAERLWRHWDCPEILWFRGSHVPGMVRGDVHSFAHRAVCASLLDRDAETGGMSA